MSCSNTPCNDPCEQNPCDYDNCGCLNPTTWECISKPGIWSDINVTDDMNGYAVLEAINNTIKDLVLVTPNPGNDVFAKVTSSDNVTDYLDNKLLAGTFMTKVVLNPGANEKIRFNVDPAKLISSDADNMLDLGVDGKLRVIQTPPIADIALVAGSGVNITGTGPAADPYVISINPSITAKRTCFDGEWRNITITATGTPSVVFISGTPQYRVRFDGTIEMRGSLTYTVNFGAYSDLSGSRKRTVTIGNLSTISSLATGCGISIAEMAGVVDLKSINYIEAPSTGDQITQQYGYIIRKSGMNIIIEFQSAFINATSKQVVVNFEGCQVHPNI